MSIENMISLDLNSEEQKEIILQLDALDEILAFTISLSPTDRNRRLRASDGTKAFLSQALALGQQYPEILPRGMDIDEMAKDVASRNFLLGVRSRLTTLKQKVDDTITVCGSEAFQGGLTVYHGAKTFGKGMGIDSQIQELGRRFKKKGNTESPPADTTALA